jgi:anti-sigma28 factor (negative regulator of flagellin synthesis)
MTIKNSGYVPNNLPGLYSNSSRKLDQKTSIPSKSPADGVEKSYTNIDTIQLSKHPVSNHTSLSKIKDQVISDINKDSDASFLETLKSQINSNQYKVDSQDMAKILLINDK